MCVYRVSDARNKISKKKFARSNAKERFSRIFTFSLLSRSPSRSRGKEKLISPPKSIFFTRLIKASSLSLSLPFSLFFKTFLFFKKEKGGLVRPVMPDYCSLSV